MMTGILQIIAMKKFPVLKKLNRSLGNQFNWLTIVVELAKHI